MVHGADQFEGIPVETLERYRKLMTLAGHAGTGDNERNAALRMAAKMAKKHPGIDAALKKLEAIEQQATTQARPVPREYGSEGALHTIQELIALYRVHVAANPSASMFGQLFQSAVSWGADQLANATSPEGSLMTIEERLDDEVDVSIDDSLVDEDTDDPLVEITVVMPAKLYVKLRASKQFPGRFAKWLFANCDDLLGEDPIDEDDDD